MTLTNDNRATSQVYSATIFAICRALDLKAELVTFQNYNQDPTSTSPKKARSTNPFVHSFTVFKICEALELKAHLRPVIKNKNPRPAPIVHSFAVFLMCQALELDVQLAKI
ncbi:hypothetical protein TNCT_302431 [Trichonephila clavata]|uniref:Uncharacterized protein n=1 Tax=Trichonephila clavata TaxID=2740835 RepID=A0A8X6KUN0_TRICU|nr:hypothetical protein TNCT_302431 [Trichonephila clavata]